MRSLLRKPVALLCAWLFHRGVDAPMQRLIEGRLSPRPPLKACRAETQVLPNGAGARR